MPISIVVGGQFGSEGKGKVALEIVRRDPSVAAVVRVGGTNSGHTAVARDGRTHVLRQIPAAAVDGNVLVVLPPGSFIDLDVLNREIEELKLTPDFLAISPFARIITQEHIAWERNAKLNAIIGSTESGTGAAVLAMVARGAKGIPLHSLQVEEVPDLVPYVRRWHDTSALLRSILNDAKRVVIEGTQGFGLSLLQGGYWPKATSRDTTAAGFLAETGLSPMDVDDVTMVIRCHPIRVAGDSGPLTDETTWQNIMLDAGLPEWSREYTTVTRRVRRVGMFDPTLVRRAICANRPSRIVLNHLDYVDSRVKDGLITAKARSFVGMVEQGIQERIDYVGTSPSSLIDWHRVHRRETSWRDEILNDD
jgi:adenylosuccinate synthase